MAEKHPNSKKITIYRTSTFMEGVQSGAKDFMSMSKKSIGSYWDSSSSKLQGSGLTFAEQDIVMPLVLDVPAEDREFRAKCNTFFSGMLTAIPFEKGLELEIGMETDNSAPLSLKRTLENGDKVPSNLPLKPMDYIRWRHASKHPYVAESRDSGEGNLLKKFYIHDPEQSAQAFTDRTNEKDKALETYLKLKASEPDKIKMMLTLLDVDPRNFKGKKAADEMGQALRIKAETSPVDFNRAYTTEHFEEKYVLRSMVNTGILKKVASKYIDPELSVVVGNNEEEAIYYLKDEENADKVMILKARMQEVLGAAVKATVK